MEDNKKLSLSDNLFSGDFTSDLMGMQSVRSTFRLSRKTISTISIISTQLGIKQKYIFDHLLDNAQSFVSSSSEIDESFSKGKDRVQKTYVISRKSLTALDDISRELNASRDSLVEHSVRRLLPLIRKEKEKHLNRKKILDELRPHLEEGKKLLSKSKKLLGDEDPVYIRLLAALSFYDSTLKNIECIVEKGEIIEKF